jgi:hypothetical protein
MDRLHVFTAAEHALAVGTHNPCGLFVHLVKNKLWKFCSERDEDLARQRLKRTLYGADKPRQDAPPTPLAPEHLSNDARLALAIHAASIQHSIPALVLVRRMRPDWTMVQFERILEDARATRKRTIPGPSRCFSTHSNPTTSMDGKTRGVKRGQWHDVHSSGQPSRCA